MSIAGVDTSEYDGGGDVGALWEWVLPVWCCSSSIGTSAQFAHLWGKKLTKQQLSQLFSYKHCKRLLSPPHTHTHTHTHTFGQCYMWTALGSNWPYQSQRCLANSWLTAWPLKQWIWWIDAWTCLSSSWQGDIVAANLKAVSEGWRVKRPILQHLHPPHLCKVEKHSLKINIYSEIQFENTLGITVWKLSGEIQEALSQTPQSFSTTRKMWNTVGSLFIFAV